MNWKLVDERWSMVESLAKFIHFRKHMFSFFHAETSNDINKVFDTQYWGNGMMAYQSDKSDYIKPFKKIAILINPTNAPKTYELDDYYRLLVDLSSTGEEINMKNGIIAPLNVQILYIK